jgi:hypothetical protein
MPNGRAVEGPFLVSAYQSLTGVDAFYWFATGEDEWTPPQSANGYMPSQGKWLFGSPDMLGSFPAAALMFRKGYIRKGEPVVSEERSLADLWQRRVPVIAEGGSFDPNRDAGSRAPTSSVKTGVASEAFLVGPVEVRYGGDPAASRAVELAKYHDPAKKLIRSITGEIALDYGIGSCTVNTPCAQGVAAFFGQEREFKLADVEINAGNEFGAVYAVSMDGKPLKSSGKVLVQVNTPSRPTGWKEAPTTIKVREGSFEGFRVESYGAAPWQIVRPKVTMKIANLALKRATVLDASGNAVGPAQLTRSATGVELRFPEDALYVVLQ